MADVRKSACAWLLAAVTAGGACSSPVTPTTTNGPQLPVTFSSRLTVGGSAWRSFSNSTIGAVTVKLALLSPDEAVTVRLGLGTFDGKACTLTTTVEVVPDLTNPQITTVLIKGDYCVMVSDIGNLTKVNDFGIVVVLP